MFPCLYFHAPVNVTAKSRLLNALVTILCKKGKHTGEPWVKEHSHCLVVVVGCNVPSSVGGQVDMVMKLSHREVGRQSDTEPEL